MFMGLPVTFLSYWGVFIVFENTLSVPVVFQCNCMTCACILSHFSCVWLFATSWTVACQAPLWDSPGKNTGVGCYFLLQGIFPTQESNLSLMSPALAGRFFTTSVTWKVKKSTCPTSQPGDFIVFENTFCLPVVFQCNHMTYLCQIN